jgi:hypothetical protein
MKKCEWGGVVIEGWYMDDFNDKDDIVWETGCGQTMSFNEGTIEDNNYRYCPYCGGEIIEGAVDE